MARHDHKHETEQPTEKSLPETMARGQFAQPHALTVLFPIAALLGILTHSGSGLSQNRRELRRISRVSRCHRSITAPSCLSWLPWLGSSGAVAQRADVVVTSPKHLAVSVKQF